MALVADRQHLASGSSSVELGTTMVAIVMLLMRPSPYRMQRLESCGLTVAGAHTGALAKMTKASEMWWVVNGEVLLSSLKRAQSGEDAEMLYLELLANSDTEDFREES